MEQFSKRRLLGIIVISATLSLVATSTASAGFAFFGKGVPVLFIPRTAPGGMGVTVPTFTASAPLFLPQVLRCAGTFRYPCVYRIRDTHSGIPFWPVPNGIPLIGDDTTFLNLNPFITPANTWGFWDPSPSMIIADDLIRVFELFTGVDLNAPPVGEEDWGDLAGVDGFPSLSPSSFPHGLVSYPQPAALDANVAVVSNNIIGWVTGTTYPTTLKEIQLQNLLAELEALQPGTPFDVSFFTGVTGRAVLS
jgi:hypothetical protein